MIPWNPALWREVLASWDGWLLTLILVAVYPAWAFFEYRRLNALPPEAARRVRLRLYAAIVGSEWLLVAVALMVARRHGLTAADLGQTIGPPERTLAVTAALLGLFGLAAVVQLSQVRGLPAGKLEEAVRDVRAILPTGSAQVSVFVLVALTAGICEEILYRGWLVSVLAAATGSLWAGVAIGGVLFGTAHAYQGRKGMLASGALGMVFGAAFALTRSLVPGQALHAAIDVVNGLLGASIVSRLASSDRGVASADPGSR